MRPLINTAKNAIEKSRNYLYHRERNQTAMNVLKTVEIEKGNLDPKIKNLCIDYANDVLGSKKYAPWLFVYSAFQREFKEGWIPDNYYGEVVIPNINGQYGFLSERNAILNKLLKVSDSLDICFYVNGLFFAIDLEIIKENELKNFLFQENKKIVYKLENTQRGEGIYFFDENSFNISLIKKLGNGVFQSYIQQHSFFSKFSESSVATIRFTSTCDDFGSIDVKSSYLRFGSDQDTHVRSDSAIKIPIHLKSGKLYDNAFFPDYKSTKNLPGNKFSFAGEELPQFDKCLKEVKKMHSNIPVIRCIGWDIIIDNNNNVKLIEINGRHSAMKFSEMIHGPCFKGLNWEKLNKNIKN